jgi:2-polyprenyl-3-methyl-5-hydroxy-6-metoxy-1,4-benzoquinol methylase
MELLTAGNSAKLYCLNWIENYINQHGAAVRILDLGSGTSGNFVTLLKRYPQVQYVGIEPSAEACAIARKQLPEEQATILNDYAYDMFGRLVHEPFDIIVSFSVLEHVVQRLRYLTSAAACMGKDSHFLINYDAGHFVYPKHLKERAKNILGPILARFGIERYYQRFVKEADFHKLVAQAGMVISEAKSFNTHCKGIHKGVPAAHQDEHMCRWLEYELWLNEVGVPYHNGDAKTWVTRNFILRKA